MGSGNMPQSGRMDREQKVEREQKRLETNVNIGRPEEFLSNELNTRRLETRDIPASLPATSLKSGSVPLERLDRVDRSGEDEESDLELMNSIRKGSYKETCQFQVTCWPRRRNNAEITICS